MIISHKHKFICLNPPKTGTGYREHRLGRNHSDINIWTESPTFVRHHDVKRVLQFLKSKGIEDKCEDYFWFTFVRNPWDRIVSWYNMRIQHAKMINPMTKENFYHFIKKLYSNDQGDKGWINGTLDNFFIKNGKVIDFVGTLESMNEDMTFISNKFNLNLNIDILANKPLPSIHKEISELWTDESINFVKKKERSVIELKNYTFGKDPFFLPRT